MSARVASVDLKVTEYDWGQHFRGTKAALLAAGVATKAHFDYRLDKRGRRRFPYLEDDCGRLFQVWPDTRRKHGEIFIVHRPWAEPTHVRDAARVLERFMLPKRRGRK